MPGKIPDRWLDYRSLGMVVKKTRFITFKVPLDNTFDNKLEPTEQFTPAMLQDQIVEMGHTLGTIVDLTNTKRYYRSEAFTASKVKYHKIFTKGHVVPSKKVCHQFFDIVDNFLAGSSSDNELLGVHCTHGLNRTGYLVCRYMVDKLGFTPQDAILEFNVARGHKIERQNYIEALSKPISDSDSEEETPQYGRRWQKRPICNEEPGGGAVDDRGAPESKDTYRQHRKREYPEEWREDGARHMEQHQHKQPHGHGRYNDDDTRTHTHNRSSGYRDSYNSYHHPHQMSRNRAPHPYHHGNQQQQQYGHHHQDYSQHDGASRKYQWDSPGSRGPYQSGSRGSFNNRGSYGNTLHRNHGNSYGNGSSYGNRSSHSNWGNPPAEDGYGSYGHRHDRDSKRYKK